jgi:RNA polymerase sigma-70 factor (ECF subfamily)
MSREFTTSAVTSASLLLRVKQHEPEAWSRLSRVYCPLVYQWSRRCGLSAEDSADIVQEVFAVLARRIDGFRRERADDTFRGWLWTIARNKVRDHVRRAQDRAVADGGSTAYQRLQQLADDAPEPWADDAERSVTEGGVVARTLAIIQTEFEPTTWQAFWLATVERKTAAEIAIQLGITKHAVHQAKYRVTRRLREEMDGLG